MSARRVLPFFLLGAVVAFITVAGAGVRATYGAHTTADEPQYLLSALSLFEDGDLDISDELAAGRYRAFHEVDLPRQTEPFPDGSQISPHDPLLPLLLAVPVGVAGWMGAKAALAIVAGGLAGLMAWTAHHRLGVRRPVALAVAGVASLSPPLAVYATQVYPEIVAATVVVAALASVLGPPGRGRLVAAGAVVALPWLAVKYVPVAAVLAVGLLVRSDGARRRRFAVWLAASGLMFVLGHLAWYGGVTPYAAGDHFVGGELTVIGTDVDFLGRATRLIGLLVDRGFGLASWQPLYLFVPFIAAWLWSARIRHRSIMLGLLGAGWLTASFVALTMHGWWFPGRQLVVVLPVAVLMLGVWADRGPWRAATVMVAGASGVMAFGVLVAAGLAGDITWVVDFAATADPLRVFASWVYPDYMQPSWQTWVLHGVWVVVAVGMALVGWAKGKRNRVDGPLETGGSLSVDHEKEEVMA